MTAPVRPPTTMRWNMDSLPHASHTPGGPFRGALVEPPGVPPGFPPVLRRSPRVRLGWVRPAVVRLAGPALLPASLAPLALAMFVSMGGCTSTGLPVDEADQTPFPPQAPEGIHTVRLTHGGVRRMYRLHVPPGLQDGRRLPVLLAFHGGGGNAQQFEDSSGLPEVARREGFLLVFPDGTGPLSLHTWNAGGCCGSAAAGAVDDVGFVAALLDDLARRAPVDSTRVYVTGHSNGGMMSYRLAMELGHRIAAAAPVGGAMIVEAFRPVRPVPLLHIHSVDDPRALYEGGRGPSFPGTDVVVDHRPVEEGLAHWRAVNGCPAHPRIGEVVRGRPGSLGAGHTATLLRWEPCISGAPVEHWRLAGAGHPWPGATGGAFREGITGPRTDVIVASVEIWTFLSRYRLPPPGGSPLR